MSRSLNNISDISKFMDECKAMGISTFGPDVNESQLKFSVNQNGDIRFGMAAVKGVGESVVDAIVSERKKNGLYKDVFDFVQRVNLNAVNRKAFESLVLSGAFDSLGVRRESFFAPGTKPNEVFLDSLIRFGQKYQADLKMSMNTLFGNMGLDVAVALPAIPEAEPWSDLERLNKERDLVGIYLSAHPLDEYFIVLNYVCNTQLSELQKDNYAELSKRTELKIGGIVTDIRTGTTKNGNPYGIVKLENYSGTGEIALFGQDWLTFHNSFMVGASLFIRAKVVQSKYGDRQELQVRTVELLSDVKDSLVEKVRIDISLGDLTPTVVEELSDIVINNPGNTEVFFHINTPDRLNDVMLKPISFKINLGKEFINFFDMHEELSFSVNGF